MNLHDCTLCPRNCHVNRGAGQTGYCGQTDTITAARAALHMWEEPCISGQTGSGTVFFSGCNMKCVFCQNHTIAKGELAKAISTQRLAEIFLELQEQKACNINLVTPTHFIPLIIKALDLAKNQGLHLPIVYNTSSYEKVETLKKLEGLVDIYLPDLKYFSPALSQKYSNAQNYFSYAAPAIEEMLRQVGTPVFIEQTDFLHPENEFLSVNDSSSDSMSASSDDDYSGPLMKKGVIVRHLALPGCMKDSKAVLRYLYQTYKNDIYISIMNQYTPVPPFLDTRAFPELNRTLSPEEYDELTDYAISLGIENGFIQEGETCLESFIPVFDYRGL